MDLSFPHRGLLIIPIGVIYAINAIQMGYPVHAFAIAFAAVAFPVAFVVARAIARGIRDRTPK